MINKDLPSAEYHVEQDHLSCSILKQLVKSPAHYEAYLTQPRVDTADWLFGRVYHSKNLDKSPNYIVMPPAVKTRRGKLYDKLIEENPGVDLIKRDEYEHVCAMTEMLKQHPIYDQLYACDLFEASIFQEYENLNLKIRPDAADTKTKIIYDLKTTRDASHDLSKPWSGFVGEFYRFDYDLQAYLYMSVFSQEFGHADKMVFVAQEKTPPYNVQCFSVPFNFESKALESGREKFLRAMDNFRVWQEAKNTGQAVPGYGTEEVVL
jgi:hypothetical protein